MNVLKKMGKAKQHIIRAIVLLMFSLGGMGAAYMFYAYREDAQGNIVRDAYGTFAMIVVGIILLLLLVIYLLQCYTHIGLEKLYLICGLTMGILFLFLIPPHVTPDEPMHWNTAYETSNELMNIKSEGKTENRIMMRTCDTQIAYLAYANRDYYNYLLAHVGDKALDTTLIEWNVEMADVSGILYLPAAIGITIGRLFRLGALQVVILAGLCNVIFFVLCSYYAMKKLPFGKLVLFVFCLLPMVLQQTSSMSYDNILLAVTVLIVGLSLHWAYGKEQIRKSEVVIYILASYVMLICKSGAYAVLCFLPFLLKCTKDRINRRNIGIVAAFAAFFLIVMFAGNVVSLLGTSDAPAAETAVADIENAGRPYITWAGTYGYSLRELVMNPIALVSIFARTLVGDTGFYLESMIGSPLGWLTIHIPSYVIYGFLFLLIAAAVRTQGEPIYFRTVDKLGIWVMCAIGGGLSMLAMLLYWTPHGYDKIAGVQGRYFLPVLLPFLLTLRGKRIEWKENCQIQISVATVFLELLAGAYLLIEFI